MARHVVFAQVGAHPSLSYSRSDHPFEDGVHVAAF